MNKNFLILDNIQAYSKASELSDFVWKIIIRWDSFNKNSLGHQYTRALDSIAANIAEGFGRFHKKDKEKFFYNARGSLYESIHWTEKAKARNLLTEEESKHIIDKLSLLPKEINWLIKITEAKLTK